MNAQITDTNMVGNNPHVREVIRCEQLTKRYPDGNILAADRLDLSMHGAEIFGLPRVLKVLAGQRP